jgi:large subunit ribosomal protein L10
VRVALKHPGPPRHEREITLGITFPGYEAFAPGAQRLFSFCCSVSERSNAKTPRKEVTQLAISREKKETMTGDYVAKLAQSQALILADYRGLTVAATTELRQRLRALGGSFHVVKNTLFRRTLEEAGIPVSGDQFTGPTALSFCLGEVPPVVKALMDFANENDALILKGALWGHTFLDLEGTKALATLPSRDVLLGQLLGAVQGPMVNLVSVLNAPLRELVQVLAARGEQAEPAEEAAA